MSLSAAPGVGRAPRDEPVAPWWHTVMVMAPIAAASIASGYQHGYPDAHLPGLEPRLSSYLTVLVVEWLPVVLIWRALRSRGLPLAALIGGRWPNALAFLRDLGLGAGLVIPQTPLELAVYLVMALSAGFCEELIFRGYLMRQLSAWTGSRTAGLLLQGIVFGLAHAYYRWVMVAIAVLAWLLGILARWRRSLLPGMLFHAVQDSLGGVIAFVTRRA